MSSLKLILFQGQVGILEGKIRGPIVIVQFRTIASATYRYNLTHLRQGDKTS
jgi:uncharacterized protein (DUF1330 family)